MEIVAVGTGTVALDGHRVCSSYLVVTGGVRLLLDCGPGAVHHMARFGVPWDRITHVVLTHFHTDHIGDLPLLLFALRHGLAEPRRDPLAIIGPSGTRDLFHDLARAFGDHMIDPGFPLPLHEIDSGETFSLEEDRLVRAHATAHRPESLGFRVETPEGALGYTGDTGPDPTLGTFFRGVDLLIAECSLPDDLAIPIHLSPSSVAALARAANPRRLALTHIYPQLDRTRVAELVRGAGWEGPVLVLDDGDRVTL